MKMRTALLVALAATAMTAAACDNAGTQTAEAPAAPAPPPPPAAPPPPPPPPAEIPGLSAPFADEAAFVAGCSAVEPKIDASICACVGKATVKSIGAKALYSWVWEGYVQRVGMGKVRSDKWFTDNALDKAAQQKFADAVGKCYVTQ
jgi:hypothetical protein